MLLTRNCAAAAIRGSRLLQMQSTSHVSGYFQYEFPRSYVRDRKRATYGMKMCPRETRETRHFGRFGAVRFDNEELLRAGE